MDKNENARRLIKTAIRRGASRLILRDLDLEELPETIGQAKKITHLDISENNLKELPDDIKRLRNLKSLNASNNNFTELNSNFNFLKNVVSLDLRNNNLNRLDKGLKGLSELEHLILDDNTFEEIPEVIGELPKLSYLHLKNNYIKSFPSKMKILDGVYWLDLDSNLISEIPISFRRLQNLYHLKMRNNMVEFLPEYFYDVYIPQLFLEGNPFKNVPDSVVKGGAYSIYLYLESLLGETDYIPQSDAYFINEAKLIVLGEARAGKTSIAKSLINTQYELMNEPSTEGIDIYPLKIPVYEINENQSLKPVSDINDISEDFKLNIWDFGGQEIYHSTHQFFLTHRSIYLLVLENRKEYNENVIYYWLKSISSIGGNCPIIIVLNKCDQPISDFDISRYKNDFENIFAFKRISCRPEEKYKETIFDLRDTINQIIKTPGLLPKIGTQLPPSWVRVRKVLTNYTKGTVAYLSFDDFFEICVKNGLESEEQALLLSNYLHDIGAILHFGNDLALRDMVFLDPQWVTSGIYKIFDNQKIKNNNGKFTNTDLKGVFDDSEFSKRSGKFLELMKKFDLCFSLDSKNHLIPHLLTQSEPSNIWDKKAGELSYYFFYDDFMPKGIIPKFIVKRYIDIWEEMYWRTGVVLEYNNTKALIKENKRKQTVEIRLNGKNKRQFLTIIRKSFEEVHVELGNIKIVEKVPCDCRLCQINENPNLFRINSLVKLLKNGKPTIDCIDGDEKIKINDLLNKYFEDSVDKQINSNTQTIFICNTEDDSKWKAPIKDHLRVIQRNLNFDIWSDDNILPGANKMESIKSALDKSSIILLLISPQFLASDFIMREILPIILNKAETSDTKVIPIIIKHSIVDEITSLQRFHSLNPISRPLSELSDEDKNRVFVRLSRTVKAILKGYENIGLIID